MAAHAAMKLLFEVMEKSSHKMSLGPLQAAELLAFLHNPVIKIQMVADEAALHAALSSNILCENH